MIQSQVDGGQRHGEAQEMFDLAGSGALDLSVLGTSSPLAKVNEALDDGLPTRRGGIFNFIISSDHARLGSRPIRVRI